MNPMKIRKTDYGVDAETVVPQKGRPGVKPLIPFFELRHSFLVAMFCFLFVFA